MIQNGEYGPSCPIPKNDYPRVLLAHGGGGELTHQLLERMIVPAFDSAALNERHDGAVLDLDGARVAFSTDSYVVKPLFFPGGDIGTLAVFGTVNDLAMCGARPLYLSAGFIIEEGLAMDTLWRIVRSMRAAALEAGVELVTGDTKVVERGSGDEIFISTAGIGTIRGGITVSPAMILPGDLVVLNGDIGRHGMAIMASREGLTFESGIVSDCASLAGTVGALIEAGIAIRCLRDCTRGGLAAAVIDLAETAGIDIDIDEAAIPVDDHVRGACEILGLDPLHVANEGRFIAFVPEAQAGTVCDIMRSTGPRGAVPSVIGRVSRGSRGAVSLKTAIGTRRRLSRPSGEQLPRIC